MLGDNMENTNRSLWQEREIQSFNELNGDKKTDVLIIGGGLAGVLTAYFLEKKGVNYILVEKDKICQKTTANTTAKITLQHGLVYHKLLKSRGFNTTQGYYEANKKALKTYGEICKEIDCDFCVKDNFVYSTKEDNRLEMEMEALSKIGCKAEFLSELPIPVCIKGAVCVPNQAEFHPLKFISEISKNLNIYENTKVLEMIGNTAVTERGKIFAKRVVVATHFPFLNKHGSYFLKLYQHRSYVLALENAKDVKGMYVDEDNSGLSFRNYKNYLLLGGGGHRTGKNGGGKEALRKFKERYYPDAQEIFSWATQDCMSVDSSAYIGKYSASTKNLYVATGFNKWGMTGSMVSAQILSDMLTGKKNEYEEVFNPSRNFIKPQLFVNAAETAANLILPTQRRCPHLGCALKYNPQEHSWDCACHGSRFDENGKLLDGPATADIKNHLL